MRFWDSSALVPFLLEEARSDTCRLIAREDRDVAVWMFTETESLATIHRARAAQRIDDGELLVAERRLDRLARSWRVIADAASVRREAHEVIRRRRIRAADALQLAAARVWAKGHPKGRIFVVADEDLARAAEAEGFDVRLAAP